MIMATNYKILKIEKAENLLLRLKDSEGKFYYDDIIYLVFYRIAGQSEVIHIHPVTEYDLELTHIDLSYPVGNKEGEGIVTKQFPVEHLSNPIEVQTKDNL
jgi:hypothetical protein